MSAPPPSSRPIGKGRRKAISDSTKTGHAPGERPPAPWELERSKLDDEDDPGVLIRTRGLRKEYGDIVAVDRLDLEVRAGEIYGLLGPNGAGKTTTILMLLGLSEPTDGEAKVVGFDPQRHPLDVKRAVGYLPDNAGFYGGMSGRANLRYTAALNGLRGAEADARVDEVLHQVGLADSSDRPVETYSRGMRQRLGIADALVKDPLVLILDEPTIAIDPQGVAEILGLIRTLVHERGLAMLLSSHMLEQVQSVCDRVGIFVKGQLIAEGPVQELRERYGSGADAAIEVGILGPDGTKADGGLVVETLRAVPGVREVETGTELGRWRVTADGDPRAAIASAVDRAGLSLIHLGREEMSLDTIYRRAVGAPAALHEEAVA